MTQAKKPKIDARMIILSSIVSSAILLVIGYGVLKLGVFITHWMVTEKPVQGSTETSKTDLSNSIVIDHGQGVAFIYLGNLPGSKEIPFYAEKFEEPFAQWKKEYPTHAQKITGITTLRNNNYLYIILYSTD